MSASSCCPADESRCTLLPPEILAATLSEAGRRGGQKSGATKRERRRRYEAGEMGMVERRQYERWVAANRAAGKRGGWPTHRKNRAASEAADEEA